MCLGIKLSKLCGWHGCCCGCCVLIKHTCSIIWVVQLITIFIGVLQQTQHNTTQHEPYTPATPFTPMQRRTQHWHDPLLLQTVKNIVEGVFAGQSVPM